MGLSFLVSGLGRSQEERVFFFVNKKEAKKTFGIKTTLVEPPVAKN
jgi:hypothetical protein